MQRLEVSSAVRLIYTSLDAKGLTVCFEGSTSNISSHLLISASHYERISTNKYNSLKACFLKPAGNLYSHLLNQSPGTVHGGVEALYFNFTCICNR